MNGNSYLQELLESQGLREGCDELIALDAHRKKVDALLREAYPLSNLTFTHGGSRAKGTMIRDDYDLDEVCYFQNEDTAAGDTLEDIYNDVTKVLEKSFKVRQKRSALRLCSLDGKDLKIDVVPGRYTDGTMTDVFLHQNDGKKERLKTNLEVQISFVRDSGRTDVISLGKLWRTRNGIVMKTFPLELLVIDVLSYDNSGTLEERFKRVLQAFAENIDNLHIEDPANPAGNDMSSCLTDELREELSTIAQDTLDAVEEHGWEHVFGKIEKFRAASAPRVQVLQAAAASVAVPTRPWAGE
jgi:hypothetical protein